MNFIKDEEMRVTKRNGITETISFDKILKRFRSSGKYSNGEPIKTGINYTSLAMKVIDQLYDKISTTKIDELCADQSCFLASTHPDYSIIAANIIISNHHKNTNAGFYKTMTALYKFKNKQGKIAPLIDEEFYSIVKKNATFFDSICDYSRDYAIDYFGFKTLERSYLMRINGKIVERPQHLWLRVAIGIHKENIDRICQTYEFLSKKYMTHATPTLFNSGTPSPQLSSCFLMSMESDSINGIFNTLKECAVISKWAGGIGLHIHNVRATGSHIQGTNGTSNGIVPMLRVFNNTAKYVDQCLDENTLVYTKRGPIPIKKIVIGDKVISDDGDFHKIGKILDNEYEGPLYTVELEHSLAPLKLTDMHPLWTKTSPMEPADFVEVKKINEGDLIGFPVPIYQKDIKQYTTDDCRMYGILIGAANYHIKIFYADEINIFVNLHFYRNRKTIEFIETYLYKLAITYHKSIRHDYVKINWRPNNMFKFTKEMIYREEIRNYDFTFEKDMFKFVLNDFLHLPKEKVIQFLRGFMESTSVANNSGTLFSHPSHCVIESIKYILLRFGILSSKVNYPKETESFIIYPDFPDNGEKTIESSAFLYKDDSFGKTLIEEETTFQEINFLDRFISFLEIANPESFVFSRVINNTFVENHKGRVIDIEVDNEDHHNFLTENGLVKNGGGKRNGSIAIYLEPWHSDIEIYLQLRKNHGDEELKARDLFYALWIPDLFMERVKADQQWTLMCPNEFPGLSDVYGDKFVDLYTKYEQEGRGKKTISARQLWYQILDAQMETGTPYLLYKDAANKKSNQKNIGTIKSSNLCVAPETYILTDKGQLEIQFLEGKKVNVWNGIEFSNVEIFKTGKDQELIQVKTSDGCSLFCTKYHHFFVLKEENDIENQNKSKNEVTKRVILVEAQNLKIGDELKTCNFPILENPYTKMKKDDLDFSHSEFVWLMRVVQLENADNYSFFRNGNLFIHRKNKVVLSTIKISMQKHGINPIIKNNDLIVTDVQIKKLENQGFVFPSTIRTNNEKNDEPLSETTNNVTITDVIFCGRRDDTYCFTEPKNHAGVFNGIYTSQCTEIIEYSDENETAVCFPGDTKVLTKTGYHRIDECDGKEILSFFSNDTDFIENQQFVKANLIDNGFKDVYEVECYGKKKIKSTADHLFVVMDEKNNTFKWKKMIDLTRGDKVFFPKTACLPGFDISIMDCVDEVFLENGWNTGMKKKNISDIVFKSEPNQIASFLSGLFSYNGYFKETNDCIVFESPIIKVIEEVQILLQCFSIDSNIVSYEIGYKKLFIRDRDSILRFHKNIHFMGSGKYKQNEFNYFLSKITEEKHPNITFSFVNKKKFIGKEKVYDLGVEETHNFVAEGFAVHNCNLASISLPAFVEETDNGETIFNYERLHDVARTVTYNLNKVIDINFYPTDKCKKSNFRNRPIGIGVQGLADVFFMMDLPFISADSKKINMRIFETIYHAALEESCALSQKEGAYETFEGSPASEGLLQFDLWKQETPGSPAETYDYVYDWDTLKAEIKKHGLRNSLLLAPMPTASTSQILGNNECFEPITSNIYTRQTSAGNFILANKYLIKDLVKLNLWNDHIKNNIILNNGSIQQIEIIPEKLREKYKTVWEMPMKELINMSTDRAIFICQSQSLNLWVEDPTYNNLTSMHFYAWSKGLKTGLYYLRRRAAYQAQRFTIEPDKQSINYGVFIEEENEVCENCGA